MAENSLFAILLRARWWISFAIAAALVLLSFVLLPATFRLMGIVAGLPFAVIGAIALRRQWGRPGAAQVARITEAAGGMAWPAFAALLESSFRRDGCTIARSNTDAFDFELERPGTEHAGRKVLVSARRWKAARTGIEPLRALQAVRESRGASGAITGSGSITASAAAAMRSRRRNRRDTGWAGSTGAGSAATRTW